jgi:hypothetical protein
MTRPPTRRTRQLPGDREQTQPPLKPGQPPSASPKPNACSHQSMQVRRIRRRAPTRLEPGSAATSAAISSAVRSLPPGRGPGRVTLQHTVGEDGACRGKGGGFADLEFALATAGGLIGPQTVAVTTVRELQVRAAGTIPLAGHGVPADFIIRPSASSTAAPPRAPAGRRHLLRRSGQGEDRGHTAAVDAECQAVVSRAVSGPCQAREPHCSRSRPGRRGRSPSGGPWRWHTGHRSCLRCHRRSRSGRTGRYRAESPRGSPPTASPACPG